MLDIVLDENQGSLCGTKNNVSRILTVFLHGTGSERSDMKNVKKNNSRKHSYRQELIRYFENKIFTGQEELSQEYTNNQTKFVNNSIPSQRSLVLDGSGSTPHLSAVYGNSMPGSFDPNDLTQKKTRKRSSLWGQISGFGWDENAQYAVNIIQKTHREKPFEKINLVGWSRGGILAIMIANLLFKSPELRKIEINIMAVDPVNGPFSWVQSHYTLPVNVRHFSAIIKSTADKPFFTPLHKHKLVVMNPYNTIIDYLYMPGNHSMTAEFVLEKDKVQISDPALALCYDYVYRFLTQNGSEFCLTLEKEIALSAQEKLSRYTKVAANRRWYEAQGKSIFRRVHHEYTSRLAPHFINQEHQSLYQFINSMPKTIAGEKPTPTQQYRGSSNRRTGHYGPALS